MNNGLVTAYDAHVFHSFIHWTRKTMCQLLRVPVQPPLSGFVLLFHFDKKKSQQLPCHQNKTVYSDSILFLCYQLLQKKLSSYQGRVVSLEAFSVAVESES